MLTKFKSKKKIKINDIEKRVINYFTDKDNNASWVFNPEVDKGVTRPDLMIDSGSKKYIFEVKSRSPMLSDISMLKQAGVEYFKESQVPVKIFLVYTSVKIREDVKEFAETTGVKLVPISNLGDLDDEIDKYYYI
ncbi:MAG: hypothetical protein ACFFEN_10700 [Candidatus Thorarchaeota archaeon]